MSDSRNAIGTVRKHRIPLVDWGNGPSDLEKRHQDDAAKEEDCDHLYITLIVIPYFENPETYIRRALTGLMPLE